MTPQERGIRISCWASSFPFIIPPLGRFVSLHLAGLNVLTCSFKAIAAMSPSPEVAALLFSVLFSFVIIL
jgi:hypothetical protein